MLQRTYYNEQDLRKRQIDTLKIFNDNVLEIDENTEYRVEFTADGKSMSLTVILSPDFPNEKPSIFVNPAIQHPWISENNAQVVGAPGLINYTQHSDLGRVVQAIIREFQRSLPSLDDKSDASTQSLVSAQSLMFPELSELTVDELQEILENQDLQDKLLENSPQLVELELETEELMSSIERIAQDNIAKQRSLDDLKTEVIDRISTIVQMKMNYEELHRKHQKLAEMYDPHRIRDCLKIAAMQADEDAEGIAEQFLLGNMPVETFIVKFAEKRAMGQARRAREERLAHQLAQLDRATT
ncbi:vacuolar protein sorting-associated protein 37A-like [Plodia interpunctella]|uniref:vacuolar protein sorting-associated protein 37A-like n=1 Tax=Plodia interpunctella TaxID=58824 RepID=UPI002368E79A|nr:vacuolar protein sorting-associated protein 37A-like isoform X2 [Plodia interpunctella]